MSAPKTIRIAAVDDDASFLAFLAEAVAPHRDLQLCATALTVHEALSLLQGPPADVILVDLCLPDGSGTELIARVAEAWPTCEVLVSTSYGDDLSVIESFEAGASGYLLKQPHAGSLVEDIRMLHAGGSPISPMIARLVLQRLKPGPRSDAPSPSAPGAPEAPAPASGASRVAHEPDGVLSAREREVLELITKGFTTEEIAGLMSLSRNTVLTYVRRTYRKLNVSSKTEAVFEARSQGLIR
jgi:DNA-binding NarL/FixJ family response regulator